MTRFAPDEQIAPQEPIIPHENQDLGALVGNQDERESSGTKPENSCKDAEQACKNGALLCTSAKWKWRHNWAPKRSLDEDRRAKTKFRFGSALSDVASNLLGILEGKEPADKFLDLLWAGWEAAEDFRLAHGDYPAPDVIEKLLPDLSKRLTDAERSRIGSIVIEAGRKALLALERNSACGLRTGAGNAFYAAVQQSCDKIIEAAKIPTYVLKQQEKIRTEEAAARRAMNDAAARKQLADELRGGRRKLRELQEKIEGVEAQKATAEAAARKALADKLVAARCKLRELQDRIKTASDDAKTAAHTTRNVLADELRFARRRLSELRDKFIMEGYPSIDFRDPDLSAYPAIPLSPEFEPGDLPETSGIYFLWAADTVEYVGRSVNLNQRLRPGGHHILRADHRISFLLFDKKILTWAECYYIGIAKPPLNFGGMP